MEFLASLLVAKPLSILAVAALFLVGHLALRFTALGASRRPRTAPRSRRHVGALAFWEWAVQVRTPEANIRVDLLVIWPALAVLSARALFRSLRQRS